MTASYPVEPFQAYRSPSEISSTMERVPIAPIRGALVYEIRVGAKVVYVGFTQKQPRRTILRHFQAPTEKYKYSGGGAPRAIWTVHDLSWLRRGSWRSWRVRVRHFANAANARAAEAAAIRRLDPPGNAAMRSDDEAPF